MHRVHNRATVDRSRGRRCRRLTGPALEGITSLRASVGDTFKPGGWSTVPKPPSEFDWTGEMRNDWRLRVGGNANDGEDGSARSGDRQVLGR
jgi:hypothetical protein